MYLPQFMAYEIVGLVKSQPICIDTILPIRISFISISKLCNFKLPYTSIYSFHEDNIRINIEAIYLFYCPWYYSKCITFGCVFI